MKHLLLAALLIGTFAAIASLSAAQNPTVVLAWGSNSNNLLLQANSSVVAKIPVLLPSSAFDDEEIISISAGTSFAVAVTKTGKVYSWGSNSDGQLGNGTSVASSSTPVRVSGLGPEYDEVVIQVATSQKTAVALTSDGFLWTWGSNTRGVLGNGTTHVRVESSTSTPVWALLPSTATGKAISISCGEAAFCSVFTDAHEVYTWGTNENGQLGASSGLLTYVSVPAPINTTLLTGGAYISSVATGGRHMLALTSQGRVLAWGSNSDYQLGTNTSVTSTTWPIYSNFTLPVSQISAGQGHSLVLTNTSAIYGWGLCQNFQLGSAMTGDTLVQATPIAFADQGFLWGNVTSLVGYDLSTFAITDKGRFYGWGSAQSYILGSATLTQTYGPLKVNLSALPDDSYFITQFTASALGTTAYAIASPDVISPVLNEPVSNTTSPANQEPPPFHPTPAPVIKTPTFSGGIPTPSSGAAEQKSILTVTALLLITLAMLS